MTAQPVHSPKVMPVPAATPAAIRAVLVNAGEPGLVERFDFELDTAVRESRRSDSIEPLNKMLQHWRAEAASWRDPEKHRAFLAEIEGYATNGIPPEKRRSTDQVLQALEARHGPRAMARAVDKLSRSAD